MRIFWLIFPLLFVSTICANKNVHYYTVNATPHRIHVVDVDLKHYHMQLAPAWVTMLGLSAVPEIAKRNGAIAAINASFYHNNPAYAGTLANLSKKNGMWQSLNPQQRGAMGWTGGVMDFDRIHVVLTVDVAGKVIHPRLNIYAPDQAVLYTPAFHQYTLTEMERTEIVIRADKVIDIILHGNNPIPQDGAILSFPSNQSPHVVLGDDVVLKWEIEASENQESWATHSNVLGGAPLLMKNGVVIKDFTPEKTMQTFLTKRHARSAICRTQENHLLLMVVDHDYGHANAFTLKEVYKKLRSSGKSPDEVSKMSMADIQQFVERLTPDHIEGFSMPELADFMVDNGCYEGLNLDGGNSSTLYFDGSVVNMPSNGESVDHLTPVSDALVIVPRSDNNTNMHCGF